MKKLIKALIIILVIVALIFVGVMVAGNKYAEGKHLTMNEIEQKLDDIVASSAKELDKKYSVDGSTAQISDFHLEFGQHPSFEVLLWDHDFINSGRVEGTVRIVVDSPAAYPYLEKETYDQEDAGILDNMKEMVHPDPGMYVIDRLWIEDYMCSISLDDVIFLDSAGNEYTAYYVSYSRGVFAQIQKNGEVVFDYAFYRSPADDNGSCPWCNGTGGMKYNYGSSDLEAIFSGHAPSTYGTCGSCGGSGKSK